jgi:HAD superfamily hydrolase (TIGR01509 family)
LSPAERPELVIFDCDGVLVDSERLAVEIEVEGFAELGWQLTPLEVAERFLGVSDADYVAMIEGEIGRQLPAGWMSAMNERLRQAFEEKLEPVAGVEAALTALEAAGLECCVASSGRPEKIRHSLDLTGLSAHFGDRLFSAVDVERGKPAPDLFLHAAASLGHDPSRCTVVEDSPFGLQAARAAGMAAVGYDGGLVPRERLGLAGVSVIADMAELAPLLLDS